jgi:EmrB/QacA subfamily drug resistance transporter
VSTSGAASAAQRIALITLAVSSFALPLMLSSVNVALPSVARALRMDAVLLSWVQLTFLTASAATVLAFGRLADLVGRKRIYTIGTVALLVSSLLAASAPNASVLLICRGLQGASAAMIYATQIAILTSVYPPQQRGQAIGMLVSAVYFGLTLGPLLGGWLVEHFSWRAAFVSHLPLNLLVLLCGIPRMHGEWKAQHPGRFDFAGALLYAVAIVALMWGGASLPAPGGAFGMGLGALGMVIFFRHQHGRKDPLFDVSLFYTNRVFALSSLASLLMYATTYSTLVLVSLYLQYLKGLTPTQAGLIMLAQPLMSALLSPAAGRLSDRIEPRVIATLGVVVTALGLLLLSRLQPLSPLAAVTGCLLVTGIGFSLFSSPNANAIMSGIDQRLYGTAGAVVATMRVLGQLCSMGLVAIAFAVTMGRVEILPETYAALERALHLSFLVAVGLCVPAMFCSLARGRMR